VNVNQQSFKLKFKTFQIVKLKEFLGVWLLAILSIFIGRVSKEVQVGCGPPSKTFLGKILKGEINVKILKTLNP
jgi:hypothetical protein